MQPPLGPPRVRQPRPWEAPSPRSPGAGGRMYSMGPQNPWPKGGLGLALPQRRWLVWAFSASPECPQPSPSLPLAAPLRGHPWQHQLRTSGRGQHIHDGTGYGGHMPHTCPGLGWQPSCSEPGQQPQAVHVVQVYGILVWGHGGYL